MRSYKLLSGGVVEDSSVTGHPASLYVQKRVADLGHAARLKGVPRTDNPYQGLSDLIGNELVDVAGRLDPPEIERTLAAAWWCGWDRFEPDKTYAETASPGPIGETRRPRD